MSNSIISIFDNKGFFEIISEIKLFSKFKNNYYENLDLCVKDAEEHNLLAVFFLDKKVRSISETFEVGTLIAVPSNLPFIFGKTRPIAFAAPVEVGIKESVAVLALLRSLCKVSRVL